MAAVLYLPLVFVDENLGIFGGETRFFSILCKAQGHVYSILPWTLQTVHHIPLFFSLRAGYWASLEAQMPSSSGLFELYICELACHCSVLHSPLTTVAFRYSVRDEFELSIASEWYQSNSMSP